MIIYLGNRVRIPVDNIWLDVDIVKLTNDDYLSTLEKVSIYSVTSDLYIDPISGGIILFISSDYIIVYHKEPALSDLGIDYKKYRSEIINDVYNSRLQSTPFLRTEIRLAVNFIVKMTEKYIENLEYEARSFITKLTKDQYTNLMDFVRPFTIKVLLSGYHDIIVSTYIDGSGWLDDIHDIGSAIIDEVLSNMKITLGSWHW